MHTKMSCVYNCDSLNHCCCLHFMFNVHCVRCICKSAEKYIKEEEEDCTQLSAEYNPCDRNVIAESYRVNKPIILDTPHQKQPLSIVNPQQTFGCAGSQIEGTLKSTNVQYALYYVPQLVQSTAACVIAVVPNRPIDVRSTSQLVTPAMNQSAFLSTNQEAVVGATPRSTNITVEPNVPTSVEKEHQTTGTSNHGWPQNEHIDEMLREQLLYTVDDVGRPKCGLCGVVFKRVRYLERHISVHTGEKPHKCSFCNEKFRTTYECDKHELRHKGLLPQCPVCGGRYVSLQKHMLVHSDSNRTHICSVCQKAFRLAGTLRGHMLVHTGERRYTCNDCGGRFRTAAHLKSHMLIHTKEKNYGPCDVCGQMFSSSTGLKSHMRTHSEERPFRCEACGKGFKQKLALDVHKAVHSSEKPFVCSVCGKQFKRDVALWRHKLIHTGEQPYECSVCGMRFNQSCSVKRHMLIHTGEKPYSCSDCGERFTQSGGLHGHRRRHCPVIKKGLN